MVAPRVLVCLALCGLLVATVTAAAQSRDGVALRVEHNFSPTYAQGSEHELWARIRLIDERTMVERGVLFLNVVENDEAGRSPQAMHVVFASATEVPNGQEGLQKFLVPLDGAELRAGVEARVRVALRERAPLGSYSIVFQLFEGDETNPHKVRVENRAAMWSHRFEVVP